MVYKQIKAKNESILKWYEDVLISAGLITDISVPGSFVIQQYGLQIINEIQTLLKSQLYALGYEEIRLPSFIPTRLIGVVNQFPEGSFVITSIGDHTIVDPLILRPTTDMLMGRTLSMLDKTDMTFPFRIFQWAKVYRSENTIIPFLSVWEDAVLEAFTFHKKEEETFNEIENILVLLKNFCLDVAALPILTVPLNDLHQFPYAELSYGLLARPTSNSIVRFGALHYLERNFSTEFDISVYSSKNRKKYLWTTSWALSEALLAAIFVTHGDDKGLILPPKLAPIQIIIIPIYHSEEIRAACLKEAFSIKDKLKKGGLRVAVDERERVTPGYKFNDWEMKGVPLRIEIGQNELSNGQLSFVRRDDRKRVQANTDSVYSVATTILEELHKNMTIKALRILNAEGTELVIDSYDQFRLSITKEWVQTYICGQLECMQKISEETGATLCFVEHKNTKSHKCIRCQVSAKYKAVLALPLFYSGISSQFTHFPGSL